MWVDTDPADQASEIVDGLKRFGVTEAEVAAVAHVSDRAVRDWRESVIRTENYDRLAELRDLVLLLSNSLSARGVAQGLRARNRTQRQRCSGEPQCWWTEPGERRSVSPGRG